MNSKAIKKQLLAAVAMVLVAAVALGSSTYAWFVASGTVTAKGMSVKAQSEGGILIKEYNNTSMQYGTVADVNMQTGVVLYPTSTPNLNNWYKAKSTNADNAKYKEDGSTTYVAGDYTAVESGLDSYRLVKSFSIRSATNEDISNAALAITDVTVAGGSASENFNKAVRVGVKVSEGGAADAQFYIYAPLAGGNFTLAAGYHDGSTGLTEKVAPGGETDVLALNGNSIPASDGTLKVDVFVWYEGEDENCKTTNVYGINIDTLSVSVSFKQVKKET